MPKKITLIQWLPNQAWRPQTVIHARHVTKLPDGVFIPPRHKPTYQIGSIRAVSLERGQGLGYLSFPTPITLGHNHNIRGQVRRLLGPLVDQDLIRDLQTKKYGREITFRFGGQGGVGFIDAAIRAMKEVFLALFDPKIVKVLHLVADFQIQRIETVRYKGQLMTPNNRLRERHGLPISEPEERLVEEMLVTKDPLKLLFP